MLKRNIILFFILNICVLNTQGINTYDLELIKQWEDQTKVEALSYFPQGMPPGPMVFCISKENLVYVIDSLPKRIMVYDLKFNFIKELTGYFTKLKKNIYFAEAMEIDKNENLILVKRENGLIKINQEGEEVFFIEKNKLPESVFYKDNFYPIDDNILFYDKNNKIKSINKEGKIIDEIKTKEIIDKTKNKKNIEDETMKEIANYAEENNFLCFDEKILLSDFNKFKKIKDKIKQNEDKSNLIKKELEIDWANLDSTRHIGFDEDKNNYWISSLRNEQLKWIIIVFSKKGELLDCFYSLTGFASVAPSGDVYIMDSVNILRDPNYKGVTFYKISRQW